MKVNENFPHQNFTQENLPIHGIASRMYHLRLYVVFMKQLCCIGHVLLLGFEISYEEPTVCDNLYKPLSIP